MTSIRFIQAATVAVSLITPTTCAKLIVLPVERLSRTRTECPAWISFSTKCEPINPAPPVTNTFIASILNCLHAYAKFLDFICRYCRGRHGITAEQTYAVYTVKSHSCF